MTRVFGISILGLFVFFGAACGKSADEQEAAAEGSAVAESPAATANDPDCSITMGWDPWEPYQYRDETETVKGLDIELVGAITAAAGCALEFAEEDWATLLGMIRDGSVDLVTGATKTEARGSFAYFTDAYRTETFALYVRSGEAEKYNRENLKSLLDEEFKVGVTLEYIYGDEIENLEDDPNYEMLFQGVNVGEVNYSKLLNLEIDGFLEDPFVAAAILRRKGLRDDIERHPMKFAVGEVHLMLSRASVDEAVIEKLNTGLAKIREDGTYDTILAKYLR